MELCKTCTERNCNARIIYKQQGNMAITKCLDYEKDANKIKGYVKPEERTAKPQRTVMGLYGPNWN